MGDSAKQRPVDEFLQHLTEVVEAPIDEPLLLRALTHRSYAYENGGLPNNERLEFLGDSVLGLVVTDTLYATHPDLPEGQLAKLRAAVVNMRALADVARTIGLGDHVCSAVARRPPAAATRPRSSPTRWRPSSARSTCRPGMDAAATLVHHLLDPLMAASATLGAGLDWKTSLQELSAATSSASPSTASRRRARTTRRPSTPRRSWATRSLGTGTGRSKKEAEQKAAELAWRALSARAAEAAAAEAS